MERRMTASTAWLDAMDADGFRELVARNLGQDADSTLWKALTAPTVIHRTRSVLGSLDSDLLAQLAQANTERKEEKARCMELGYAGRQQYADAEAEQANWKRRILGYRRLVLRRIEEVRHAARALAAADRAASPPPAPGTGKAARMHNRAALERLARAVLQHQQAVLSGEGDEGDDEDLWATVDRVTAMCLRGELPLKQWLTYLDEVRGNDGGEPE